MVSLPDSTSPSPRIRSDGMFIATFSVLGGTYVLLIILLLVHYRSSDYLRSPR